MLNGIITPLTADPLFDFLCLSVRLFQILFIQDGTSQSWERKKKNKGKLGGVGEDGTSPGLIQGSGSFAALSEPIRGSNMASFDRE